jgi:multidrug transporter EmrE-like cation transporter
LLNVQVICAFALIFVSMLVIFKALSTANFTFVIPVSAGINFILTIIAGYYIFKDQLSLASFIGFTLIISGILLLSINSTQHATQ